ncbi:hypothetical protein [Xanthomonas phage X1]|nr:hypothetical protein [Xanthomonas phage X1]
MPYSIPMYESERGWGGKIDGYAGPFPTYEEAKDFKKAYNRKYNNEARAPDYYIMAMDPVETTPTMKHDYRSTV